DENKLDLFVRANHEDIAYRLIVSRRAAFRGAGRARRQHTVELGDFQISVADQWIIRGKADDIFNVVGPFLVIGNRVDRQADNLDAASVEFRFESRHRAEFGGADRRKIIRIRKQELPITSDTVMESNLAFRSLDVDISSGII